jgi:DNA-binding IclR family transcriptional regulator
MNRYNKLKIRTLNVFVFAPGAWFRPDEVAERLDFVPRRALWTYLKRLWRFGLLNRRSSGRGTLEYRISERGAVRRRWLKLNSH